MGLVTQFIREAQDRGGLVVILLVLAIAYGLIPQKRITECLELIRELVLSFYDSFLLRVKIRGIKLDNNII